MNSFLWDSPQQHKESQILYVEMFKQSTKFTQQQNEKLEMRNESVLFCYDPNTITYNHTMIKLKTNISSSDFSYQKPWCEKCTWIVL